VTTPSAEVAKGHTDTPLSFRVFFFISVAQVVFHNFLWLRFGKVMGQGNCYVTRTILFSLSIRTIIIIIIIIITFLCQNVIIFI